MATFDHSNTNKFKALAAAVALVLHGLAGYGLVHMTMLNIEPPKITPPLEIQMITINNEESPEPLPVEMPKPTPTQAPMPKSVSAPAPPKSAPPPKVEPIKPPPPKAQKPEPKKEPPKKETPKEVVKKEPKQEQPKPEVDLLAQQKAQKAFELQQAQEREREKEREREREQEQARKKTQEAENAHKKAQQEAENAKKQAQQEAENAKKQAQQGQGKGGDGKDTKTDNKDKGDKTAKKGDDKGGDKGDKGNKDGGELKGQNLSISNASWQRRPSWDGLTSEKLSGSASFTATLTIDASGKITAVSGVNTGDKALDRQITQAIRRAKLKPFKSSGGQPMSGTASFGATVNF